MTLDRRSVLSAGTGLGLIAALRTDAAAGTRQTHALEPGVSSLKPLKTKLQAGSLEDQTQALQAAIDEAAEQGQPVFLPAGTLRTGAIELRAGSRLIGAAGLSVLQFTGGASFVTAADAAHILIRDTIFDGAMLPLDPEQTDGLLRFVNCEGLHIQDVEVRASLLNGMSLEGCSGRVEGCKISACSQAAFYSNNAAGLEITHNHISDCGNNGILVWRDKAGEDGTIIANNRIEQIAAKSGGSGEYGNGINIFRAHNVLVSGNRIANCAYSAVRGNAASNIQIVANSCSRLGEVALYAEFGFEGAVISGNTVDTAATGISVTNFNEGGRLAVVQGNLIRNLFRREKEPEDKRGEGITIEADSLVSGNVIENAPTCGILVGWGEFMRDCMVSQNLIRGARTGILISSENKAAAAMISGNMISGAKNGAIRLMDHGVPIGADLALAGAPAVGKIVLTGNTLA